jgi:hypothetical protein
MYKKIDNRSPSVIQGSPSPLSKDIKILPVAIFTVAAITVLFAIATTIAILATAPFLCTCVLIAGLGVFFVATTALTIAFLVTNAKEKNSKRVVDESQVDESQVDESQVDESQVDESQVDESQVDELELKLDLEQSDITIRTLQLWEQQKNQILGQLSKDDPNLSLINDYSTVIRSIINELQSAAQNNPEPTGGEPWDRIFRYFDATDRLQLIALYNSTNNRLAYLITNINNLGLAINKN